MKFEITSSDPNKLNVNLLALFAGTPELTKADLVLGGLIGRILKEEEFDNKIGSDLLIYPDYQITPSKVLISAYGDGKLTIVNWQKICAAIGLRASRVKAGKIAVMIPEKFSRDLGINVLISGLVTGITLGTYTFNKHKSQKSNSPDFRLEKISIIVDQKQAIANETIRVAQAFSDATCFTRDLVNEPSNVTTPTYLADIANSISHDSANITTEILDIKQMHSLGMDAILAVAKGSSEIPKFIRLDYRGGGKKTVCLAGKGITFDSGGISLKTQKGLETMKMDMAGAAAILGIFKALAILKPKINVTGLIAACENMPSGSAIKPGDIVRSLNGKTIEIINTDAEGRIVLADTLAYASSKIKPDVLIDLATLTGACVVALGEEISGLFVNNEKLKSQLIESAKLSGERIWQLPLPEDYLDLMKSKVADIKNVSGTGHGGAITAAIFLQEFVDKNIPWAHLDIAGPAFAEHDTPLTPYGGTGSGVRLLLHLIFLLAKNS